MIQAFPKWKYSLIIICVVLGLIYALPNLYGEDPAVQISALHGNEITKETIQRLQNKFAERNINYKSMAIEDGDLLIRFLTTEAQIANKDLIKAWLGDDYSVALNLAPITPKWLTLLGAKPMKLGLDLRGGVRFLIEVEAADSLARRLESDFFEMRTALRNENIRYRQFNQRASGDLIVASFFDKETASRAYQYFLLNYPQYDLIRHGEDLTQTQDQNQSLDQNQIYAPAGSQVIEIRPTANFINENRNYTLDQTIATLRNRINELGVAEAIVQRQGAQRVVVELPGIQDTARAKDILGKTATLDFVMVDHEAELSRVELGQIPPGSRLLFDRHRYPVVVKKKVILTGESITSASSAIDNRDGLPAVSVRLGGSGVSLFRKTTQENIGRRMAVIYRETKLVDRIVNDKLLQEKVTEENIISVATIQSALGNNFQITGLTMDEARDLALLLRAGALPATISIVEERIIGPSLGQDNIHMGMLSIVVGAGLVLVFMTVYYSLFGIIANLALMLNLILLVAIMSLVGATLTLPGIAGIVLTLGMAVDANVLIFERIREELRNGMTPQASIYHGFKHAFATIVDSNLTTLIVGVILFAVGSGPVRGFAVTLSIGILTSLFTSITGTRALVDIIYGGRTVKRLLVGA